MLLEYAEGAAHVPLTRLDLIEIRSSEAANRR
jgi:hypothetical protein